MTEALTRIFCVEDDPDIRELLDMSLKDLGGFEVEMAADAEQALRRAPAFKPQIVLLDVMLPNMSGPEALPLLRKALEDPAARIIFLTAKASRSARDEFLSIGADEVFFKPFDAMGLGDQLLEFWARSTNG